MERARARLEGEPGVHRVETNHHTGSLLVHYDHHQHKTGDLIDILKDAGVIVRQVAEAGGNELPEVGRSKTSTSIMGALNDMDRRISYLTGQRVDLKLLFPLAMGALGLRQTLSQGLGLSQVPGYVLLWYAFDSFYKLHAPPAPGKEDRSQSRQQPEEATAS